MIAVKRPRGRPKGSGKNDSPYLAKVAELLVGDASLTPTSAMKRVFSEDKWRETEPTLVRRWQGKWKQQSDVLLAEARANSSSKSSMSLPCEPVGGVQSLSKQVVRPDLKHTLDAFAAMQRNMTEKMKEPSLQTYS